MEIPYKTKIELLYNPYKTKIELLYNPYKTKIELLYNPATPLLGTYPEKTVL